ncbi:OLC1v1022722C1 [Oldenlandia corymbosa var. corymbosa]|uniref:OLC1v1022722C1 n=1 Tax=Oldenlandia corymbosa var. corymbosa TaxID=529605 RepID=A0AAV1BYK1_OLDCO|nr:OLC1v1022722C1 [Oldenlandia corymbosa var. corymbosa]
MHVGKRNHHIQVSMDVEHSRPLSELIPSSPGNYHRHPWLVYFHGEIRDRQTFCKISSPGVIFKTIREFHQRTIYYSSPDGNWLLLLHQSLNRFLVWSPNSTIWLPPLRPDLISTIRHGMLSLTNSTCLVLLFVARTPLILYCRVGDEKWSEFNYAPSIEAQTGTPLPHWYYLESPVSFNGTIYALASSPADLVQINIDKDNNCETRVLLREDRTTSLFCTYFLVTLGDRDLCRVVMFPMIFDTYHEAISITVFRFSFCTNSWEPMTSLNGGSIFRCDSYSLHSPPAADDDEFGSNKEWSYIHFAFDHDQTLFSYRMEDKRMTSYSLCPRTKNSPEPWISRWIMPSLSVDEIDKHIQYQHCHSVLISGTQDASKDQKRKSATEIFPGNTSYEKQKLMVSDIGSSLCDLPPEVLDLIAQNLSFVDYMHFRRVNKLCATGVVIGMRTKPFPPSLVYKDEVNGVYNIVDFARDIKLSVKIPKELENYEIRCSKDGWLLMEHWTNSKSECTIFNPLTRQVIYAGLRPETNDPFSNFTFINHPSSPSCSILTMSTFSITNESYFVKGVSPEPGEPEWWAYVVGEGGDGRFLNHSYNSPAFLGGFCYYLGTNGILGRCQLTKGEETSIHWEVFEDLQFPDIIRRFKRNYLIECGGELIAVLMGDDHGKRKIPWVQVLKLTRDYKKWEEIQTLDGFSLYLSWQSSVSFLAGRADMGNRIYFPKFYKDELVYYSLKTKKYYSVGSQHELKSFNQTSMFLDCAWIELGWK